MSALEQFVDFIENGVPFNRHMGFKIRMVEAGRCEMYVELRPELVGDPMRPALHGGVISALADTCGGLAVFSRAAADQRVSTVDLRVDYLRPGGIEGELIAASTVLRFGNRVAVTDTLLYHDSVDEPVAKVAAVYNVVRLPAPDRALD